MTHDSALSLIGGTPLVRLSRFEKAAGVETFLFGKAECMNPGGSVKDRVALSLIEDAEKKGLLAPGGSIVEPTSGNTGIGLACVAAVKGYAVTLTMPESMSIERRKLLAAYGARIELTPAAKGMQGAVDRAREIAAQTGAFLPMQFENPANPLAHERTTAAELLRDMEGRIDAVVAGVGTGGTISGLARALKASLPNLCAVAVEPEESPLLSGGMAGSHGIQGIGANFVPANYDGAAVDRVVPVSTKKAYEAARLLARVEGLLCGVSSGAALAGAVDISRDMPGKRIVVILPDTGERYLSTALFGEEA